MNIQAENIQRKNFKFGFWEKLGTALDGLALQVVHAGTHQAFAALSHSQTILKTQVLLTNRDVKKC
jgi:hypothetical protein